MKPHTKEEFNTFMSQLLETNTPLSFYTDFRKCRENVERIEMRLNQLNYLIGQQNIEQAIRRLWKENRETFSVLDILIAVRDRDKKMTVDDAGVVRPISGYFETVEGVITFIRETGLQELFQEKKVKNLVDYVFGVEVGLDSNARKNRVGNIMENLVENLFRKNGLKYRKEVYSSEFPDVEAALGTDRKRFDFVIETPSKTYLLEVNFYTGGGSKLNEVTRSYAELAVKINACSGCEFVWVTDGIGWNKARKKLEEAFRVIPRIYNFTTLQNFIEEIKGGK